MKRVFYHNNWFLPSLKLVEDANIRKCSFLCFDNTHPCMVHSRSKPDGECWILHLRQGNSQWKYTYLKMKDITSSLQSTLSKNQTKSHCFPQFFITFSYTWAGYTSVYSMKSMFWTNEKLSLMVAWSSSVSISCVKVQSSIGHLVWFFDSGNSIVSGANLWCPYEYSAPWF